MDYLHDFHRVKGELVCEKVPVRRIVEEVGTPAYIYSYNTLVGHYRKLVEAFSAIKPLICFSVKANNNLAILHLLVKEGAGLDIVSGGELHKALKAKCPPMRIVYASVGKHREEIEESLKKGIFCFNVESPAELRAIDAAAKLQRIRARVALRVNPDVEAHTHAYITTGKKETKFGIDVKTAVGLVRDHKAYSSIEIIGIHLHIGSQITQAQPFIEAIERGSEVIKAGRGVGLEMGWINLGGGLGIIYKDETPQTALAFASAVLPLLQSLKVRLILEPGRFIVGNAGILVSEVLYMKPGPNKSFAIMDAGMNDLLRPALYGAYHEVVPVGEPGPQNGHGLIDVVGPVCESADVLARDRKLGDVQSGELLAILGAGAYGSTMASNYNGRLRPVEVLVRGNKWAVIRNRDTMLDLTRHDVVPHKLIG